MKARLGVVAALVLMLAAGCGSGDEEPGVATAGGAAQSATTPAPDATDRQAALRDFAQCMRDNGVDMPDPGPGTGGLGTLAQTMDSDDPVVQAAFEACQSRLPNGGEPPQLNPEQVEIYRAFAECMRDNGVDLPDPAPDGTLQLGSLLSSGLNPDDPVFQAALNACRDHLTGLRGDGGGQ